MPSISRQRMMKATAIGATRNAPALPQIALQNIRTVPLAGPSAAEM